MKSPITKITAAAVIILAVGFGLFEFLDTGNKSSVVWAEVARKVQASRGIIFRGREIMLNSQDSGPDYIMNYLSSTQSRHDSYEGDQIIKTFYDDYNTKTVVFIDYNHKSYIKRTVEEMEQNDLWKDPKNLIQKFLSHKHRKLGSKTVDGVLCEGIETTDPNFGGANFPVDSLTARAWVSVEMGYPVLLELEVIGTAGDNEKLHITSVMDQFRWDVELDNNLFDPNIPDGYIDISP